MIHLHEELVELRTDDFSSEELLGESLLPIFVPPGDLVHRLGSSLFCNAAIAAWQLPQDLLIGITPFREEMLREEGDQTVSGGHPDPG
jgi:hypothetical protein